MSTNGSPAISLFRSVTARWVLVALALFAADVLLGRVGWHVCANVCFWSGLLIGIIALVVGQNERVRRFLMVPVDARFLPATRVIYALMCLYTASQHLWAVHHGMEPSNFTLLGWEKSKALAYACNAVYFAALIALLFGRAIRLSWIVIFGIGGLLMPFSLEVFIKQPLNFFSIFVAPALWRGERSAESPSAGWPLLMSAVCIAFVTAGAGFFKLFDPVWQHGTGFYYSMNIPFFTPKHLRPVLDSWPLMLIGNWACIVVEGLSLPLLLFRRTRLLALFCIFGLGMFLAWPMWGIGLVGGPVVLAFVPAWAGIIPAFTRRFWTWRGQPSAETIAPAMPANGAALPMYALALCWWTILGFAGATLEKYGRFRTIPPLYGYSQFAVNVPPLAIPSHVDKRVRDLGEGLALLRPYRLWEWVWLLELFDYHHLFERCAYRIRVIGQDGEERTVSIFDEARALLPQRAWFGYVHFLKPVEALRMVRHRDRLHPSIVAYGNEVLCDLARYAITEAGTTAPVREVIIDVQPLHQPLAYEGDSEPWLTGTAYEPFYRYDPGSREGRVIGRIKPFPFHLLDVPAFRDGAIVPIPDAPLDPGPVAPGAAL